MSSAANLYPVPGAAPSAAAGGQAIVSVHPSQAIAGAVQGLSGALASATGQLGSGTSPVAARQSKLAAFESLLKKAGHIAGVVLTDIVKYVIPLASIVAVVDPAAAPAVEAFTASVKLVQASVISVQQKWSSKGSEANTQRLADVLAIVEQPVVTMFAQAGMQVDTAYVTNLVNGVVAILNAQPGVMLSTAA